MIKALVALVAEQIEGPSSIGDLYSPVVLAVACHDMGQIVEAHPRGWKMLGRDAKKYLTTAMVSSDWQSGETNAPVHPARARLS